MFVESLIRRLLNAIRKVEKMQGSDISVQPRKPINAFCANINELPTVSTVIDTGFPTRLYTMAVTDDKVLIGGQSNILKLFDR